MPAATLNHIPGMQQAQSVPEIQARDLKEDFFLGEHVSQGKPLIVRGAVAHWPAVKKWRDAQYLKSRCGHHNVFFMSHENFLSVKRIEEGKIPMGFAQAIDLLHSPEMKVASLGFPAPLPELMADTRGFDFLSKPLPPILYDTMVRYFIYRNAGTTWHYHSFDETLMCQVAGSKKIGLVSASTPLQKSLHSLFFREDYYDDPTAFDWFKNADLQWLSATLEETDALYIPPLWWHGVIPVSTGFGLTAAFVWRSPPEVIAETLRKMDRGDVDMIGFTSYPEIQRLSLAARELGMELDVRRSAPLSVSIRPSF